MSGHSTPKVKKIFTIEERKYATATSFKIFEVDYATPKKVAVIPKQSFYQNHAYILPTPEAEKRLNHLQQGMAVVISYFYSELQRMGDYSKLVGKKKSILSESVVQISRPSPTLYDQWSFPTLQRMRVFRHTPCNIAMQDWHFAIGNEPSLQSNVGVYLCPKDSDWESIKTIHQELELATATLQKYVVETLGTYEQLQSRSPLSSAPTAISARLPLFTSR